MFSPIPSTSRGPRESPGNVGVPMLQCSEPPLNLTQLPGNASIPQCSEPSPLNLAQENTMAENSNNDVSSTPTVTIVKLDVNEYYFHELMVMIQNDNIVIKGNFQIERKDIYGFISKNFTRKVPIPKDIMEDSIKAYYYSNGILSIIAKKRAKVFEIPIRQGNTPAFRQQKICPVLYQYMISNSQCLNTPGFFKASHKK